MMCELYIPIKIQKKKKKVWEGEEARMIHVDQMRVRLISTSSCLACFGSRWLCTEIVLDVSIFRSVFRYTFLPEKQGYIPPMSTPSVEVLVSNTVQQDELWILGQTADFGAGAGNGQDKPGVS